MGDYKSKSNMKRLNALQGKDIADGLNKQPPRETSAPQIYRLKKSCEPGFEYWETEVTTAENPDEDFKNADKFVEFAAFAELQAERDELKAEIDRLKAELSEWKSQAYVDAERADKLQSEVDRLRAALVKVKEKEAHWRDIGHICESKQELQSATDIARQALELKGGGG